MSSESTYLHSEDWVSCSANIPALEADTTLSMSAYSVTSFIYCLAAATTQNATVAIFRSTNIGSECQVWDHNALGIGQIVKNTSLEEINCKTLDRFVGELPSLR